MRDADGVEEAAPSPEEAEIVARARDDRRRTQTIRRSVLVAGIALLALVVSLVLAQRSPRQSAQAPPSQPPAAATSRTDDSVPAAALKSDSPPASSPKPTTMPRAQAPSAARRAESPRAVAAARPVPAPEPAEGSALALPDRPAARAPAPRPDVRVDVAQKPSDGAVDYTVRVSRPDGGAVTDADVRLRGIMADGTLVEARLEPAGEPGVYRSLLQFSPRGPRALTLRVARGDGAVELPVREPAASGAPPRP